MKHIVSILLYNKIWRSPGYFLQDEKIPMHFYFIPLTLFPYYYSVNVEKIAMLIYFY